MGFFKNLTGSSVGPALSAGAGTGGMPAWLSALGASELPGGGFGGNRSFRVGNDVYTGAYTPGDVDHGVGAAFVGDFYKYGFNKQAWAGQGSVLNGTPFEKLDLSGKVIGSGKWEGIEDKNFALDSAVVALVGAALGGAAMVGAAGAGTGAAVAGGTETAAATGLSYTAAGAPVFGVVDAELAAASAAGFGGGAAGAGTTFGIVDTSFAAGPGITYNAGSPVFGVVDAGAAEASRAAAAAGSGAAGAGGGGGGSGGAGAGVSKAAGQLGLSKAVDKLGGSLLSAGVSSLVGDLMSPKADMAAPTVGDIPRTADTKTKAVSEMPDPLAQQRSRKRSIIEQLGRRGRSSTVMTRSSGRLGG